MEIKGLRVNAGETKVMLCQVGKNQIVDSGEHPCSVCRREVGCNSIRVSECEVSGGFITGYSGIS